MDQDGKDVPVGSPGEIICKGPVVCTGYHNNPAADAASFVDGWYCTGDVAEFRNGLFYIVDRKKELIKYKGYQVAPAELEGLLLSHDAIQDAAVIGIEAEGTEVPRCAPHPSPLSYPALPFPFPRPIRASTDRDSAYIVADKSRISPADVAAFVKSRLASYKQLRGGIVFIDAIPKTASGKILRKELRVLAQKELKAKL